MVEEIINKYSPRLVPPSHPCRTRAKTTPTALIATIQNPAITAT